MSDDANWLPPLVPMEEYDGDWRTYLAALYQFFRSDFILDRPTFRSKPCVPIGPPFTDGKEWSFWHLISEGEAEDERIPDMRRCERIKWPRPLIEGYPLHDLKCWRSQRGKRKRVVISLPDFSYVVILGVESAKFTLVTAFHVDAPRRQEKMRKEWREAEKYESRQ